MEVFTQFASDLDDATKAQLQHGKALMELLKQPLSHPLSMHEQVLTLCMATDGVFDKIPTRQVKQYQKDILDFMDLKHPEIGKEIEQTKALSDELRQKIKELAKEHDDVYVLDADLAAATPQVLPDSWNPLPEHPLHWHLRFLQKS